MYSKSVSRICEVRAMGGNNTLINIVGRDVLFDCTLCFPQAMDNYVPFDTEIR